MIYLLDADLNGLDSIQHLIDESKVTWLPCHTFKAFEDHVRNLLNTVTENDTVILDTITSLANTTRGDMKLGTDTDKSIWDQRQIFMADKNYLTVYEAAGQSIMRWIRNLRARGAKIVVTTHEDDQRDDGTRLTKRAPAVNAALYRALMGASSDVLRLQILNQPITDSKGVVKVPAGVRALQLRVDDDAVIKTHVRLEIGEKLPKMLFKPTWAKLVETLGKTPSFLVLYGPPGSGKTTLATGAASVSAEAKHGLVEAS